MTEGLLLVFGENYNRSPIEFFKTHTVTDVTSRSLSLLASDRKLSLRRTSASSFHLVVSCCLSRKRLRPNMPPNTLFLVAIKTYCIPSAFRLVLSVAGPVLIGTSITKHCSPKGIYPYENKSIQSKLCTVAEEDYCLKTSSYLKNGSSYHVYRTTKLLKIQSSKLKRIENWRRTTLYNFRNPSI